MSELLKGASADCKRTGCQLSELHARVARLEAALRKIAQWDMVFPEENYPCYAGMAVVTAREAVPQYAPQVSAKGERE